MSRAFLCHLQHRMTTFGEVVMMVQRSIIWCMWGSRGKSICSLQSVIDLIAHAKPRANVCAVCYGLSAAMMLSPCFSARRTLAQLLRLESYYWGEKLTYQTPLFFHACIKLSSLFELSSPLLHAWRSSNTEILILFILLLFLPYSILFLRNCMYFL